MEIARIRALRGPNLWSRQTAIEALVHCDAQDATLSDLEAFENRLRARFPDVGELPAGEPQGAHSMAHALERIALALQVHAGCPVSFSLTHPTQEPGTFHVVVQYTEEEVGRTAFELAAALCAAAIADTAFDLPAALARLRALDEDLRLGPSTGSIVEAASRRGIPFRRLTSGSLVQFGWGSRQRRIQAAELDRTGAIAETIAQDKELTKQLLRSAGVPVPQGRPIDDLDDALAALAEIGQPVVVKPRDGNQGKGVTVNVRTPAQLEQAYRVACEISSDVMIERFIPGRDFRLLVVGNRLVAAAQRDPPQVTGDGVHTVRELVEQVNLDPRRGAGHSTLLTRIRFDEIALACLAEQGQRADAVPPAGTRVVLRNNANLSTGGSATDVTDEVHPAVAAHAIDAARVIGLDICGVDIVCASIQRPLEEQGGGIVEVNAAPGLRMHLSPSSGQGRDVGAAVIADMFPVGENGRIPVVAVTGTNGKTTTVRLIAHLLEQSGLRVGMTNTDGVYVAGERIDTGDCSGPRSARNVLMHPDVDAAVFETARGGMLREGLAFDRSQVAIVTNIGQGDHLGLNHITTVEELALVKRMVVQNVVPEGTAVLNAADPIVARMADCCPGSVIFFARGRQVPALAAHHAQGGRVIYIEDDAIVAAEGGHEHRLPLARVPITHGGSIGFQTENAMAAVGAGWALGLPWARIEAGLAGFVNDAASVPGRFNLMAYRGATVIADYGHNPDAIQALANAVRVMPARRRSVVISGAGDRRDEDIRQQTRILGEVFDEVVLYEDQCQRGRADGEVLALLREGLQGARRTRSVREIHGEFLAIDAALDALEPGDLCLVLIDQVEPALAHIAGRLDQPASVAA